ncbi:2,3-diaminopropionate biosynthesis protein SbnB [Bacillus changyiensis]|uniref:2,3-diaminopropionate biosynthesis protein SbnB n=1 Tax=Bacillus changyiensis TaxID=3004103 RepID=UPI0022E5EB9C|nr:2,3-diaminopropionate biosynthesis protein SbnB [Bacillus changyiensis]MDA1478082.1 2,3-diaminopropionate biosynthesis protein SbnB [Bacillus changyiensis]
MRYLNTDNIKKIGIEWDQTIETIRQAVTTLQQQDVAQPIKPYLRFRAPGNRIIAMPAFVGGDVNMAGIKWIASFPNNIQQGIQRAHSVTILNNADTGKPLAVLNTALMSGIRTASVTGLIIQKYDELYPLKDVTVGIIGFGPIGQLHLQMVTAILGDRISKVLLYDIAGIKSDLFLEDMKDRTEVVESWEEAYRQADVFITCTVSPSGYIDQKPKERSLLLNVSLRDFKPNILDYTQSIIVDDWEEVCRENTDIELMHLQRGLQKSDTKSITEVVCEDQMKAFPRNKPILFNPMGMAIFDVAISTYYYRKALENGVGTELAD